MKRTGRVLAILLALAMLLSVTAFAATTTSTWYGYGGDTTTHNAAVTSAPTSTSPTITRIDLMNAGSGWDGIDNVPVMRTIDGVTYAYVFYDGHAAGGRLAKINCNDGVLVWDKQMTGASGFQLSSPLLVPGNSDGTGDTIYLAASYAETYSDASFTGSDAIAAGDTGLTKTFNISNITTSSNRVAAGIYLGETTVANRGTIGVTGTAQITCGSANVTLNLITSGTNSGTNVVMYEQPVYTGTEITSYKYYYYVNYNINVGSGNVGTAQTLTLTIKLTGGDGTLQYVDTYAQVAALQKVTGIETNDAGAAGVEHPSIVSGITGQINTPITTDGTYLYLGTWSGNSAQPYYQVKISDSSYKTFTPASNGFYWAGAAVVGDYVYFGSDGGKLYWRSVSDFAATGGIVELPAVNSNAAGNVRSSIMVDGTKIYFTSQYPSGSSFGNFYCFNAGSGEPTFAWGANIQATYNGTTYSGNCTSTPVIAASGNIYVGFYSGFTAGGLMKITAPTSGTVGTASLITVSGAAFTQPVQCTPVVYTSGNYDYFYFNTNSGTGAGYCFRVSKTGTNASQRWKTDNDTYALGGMAISNGYAVFGNDYNHLYIVK
ncbi:MAG: hypothetical protein ACLU3I_12980 [Acutalibacteraceae bacterium]|jgi:cell surface protein